MKRSNAKQTHVWEICGTYEGQTETIDEFDRLDEARRMLREYRIAYGIAWGWVIRLRRV